jgi:hypothetical protein
MSDRRKSTRPEPAPVSPRFDPDAALRVTYAAQIRPEERKTLDALCDATLELTREATTFAERIAFGGVCDRTIAATAELRFVAAYLTWSADAAADSAGSRAEYRLADLGERIAAQLSDLAGELEDAAATI